MPLPFALPVPVVLALAGVAAASGPQAAALDVTSPVEGEARATAPADRVTVQARRHRTADRAKVTARHSITLSPFRATWPALHARYELRLTPHLGVDVAAGTGSWNPVSARVVSAVTGTTMPDVSITEVEAAVSTYVAGRFARGVQLGLTARRQVASSDVVWGTDPSTGASTSTAFAAKTAIVGPHLGLKRVGQKGLTFQARVGGGWMFADASATTVVSAGDTSLPLPLVQAYSGPMVFGNMGIGYSF